MKWLPVFLVFFMSVSNICAKNLTVTILYESLCPDSVRFLKDQFYPAYSTVLKDKIIVELVPYGKANTTKANGTWAFTCQHKEKECYGNKVQACALDIAPKHLSIEFVVCAMKSGDASDNDNLKQCASDYNITWTDIEKCLKTGRGDELLAKHGERTNALRPNIPFVPTVIFNGVYKDVQQKLALKEFNDLAEILLEECQKCTNRGSSSTFSILVLFVPLLLIFSKF